MDNEVVTINDLSDDILMRILSYINIIERQRLEIVCKQWRKVIHHMWSTRTKLIFNIEFEDQVCELEAEVSPNCIEFSTYDIFDVVRILKTCEGSITELVINDNSPLQDDVETMVVPLSQNKNLTSFSITTEDETVVSRFIQSMPTTSLLEFNITYWNESFSPKLDLINRINEILREARALKVLCLTAFEISTTTLGEIEKLSSLQCLEFGRITSSPSGEKPCLDTKQLGNLETLKIDNETLVDDDFLRELVKNCPKLLHLTLHSRSKTDDTYWIMQSLPGVCLGYLVGSDLYSSQETLLSE